MIEQVPRFDERLEVGIVGQHLTSRVRSGNNVVLLLIIVASEGICKQRVLLADHAHRQQQQAKRHSTGTSADGSKGIY